MSAPKITRFKGLNTVADPLRLGLGWLSVADNMDVTNTAALETRSGYTKVLNAAPTSAYNTEDYRRVYLAADGYIKRLTGGRTLVDIVPLQSNARVHWTEVNKQVYFNNGVDRGIIFEDDTVHPWDWPVPLAPAMTAVSGSLPGGVYQACFSYRLADGRETGVGEASSVVLPDTGGGISISSVPSAPGCTTLVYLTGANSTVFQLYGSATGSLVWSAGQDTLGVECTTAFLDPLPSGTESIAHWQGRIYASQFMAPENQSAVWFSEPLAYHLFNLNSGYFLVPGHVLMLAGTEEALIVGTDVGIYAYTDEKLDHLAPYGVIPGWSAVTDEDTNKLMMWTQRGVCTAMPFTNITQEYVSVPPGRQVGAALVRTDGHKKFVANLVAGGSAFNQRR